MQKGDFVEILIEDMSNEGNGIGHTDDGMTIFAEGGVVGDRVRVGIKTVKKNYATGKVTSFSEKSNLRQDEDKVCPYIDKCGGCSYGRLKYEAQLNLKEKSVRDKLERLGGVESPVVRPIVAMDEPYNYRNKATISIWDELVGFKAKKSNMVVDCEECMIQSERANQAAQAVREYIKTEKARGLFDRMVFRVTSLDECMVSLYTKSGKFNFDKYDVEKLAYAIDDAVCNTLESFWIDEKLIAGKNTILDEAGDLNFEISPLSFYQTNHDQMLKLYDKVVEYAKLSPGDTILDLYCGVGTIGLYMLNSIRDGYVIGIESVKPAVIDANRNAVINYIVNARYFTGKAEEELPFMMGMTKLYKPNEVNEMVERVPEITIEHANVAVLDPPRAGCDKALLEAVVKAAPDRIVYVSCDPGTLARDVKFLTEGVKELGYKPYHFEEATPVDMFPHTGHVETVVLMTKFKLRTGAVNEPDR